MKDTYEDPLEYFKDLLDEGLWDGQFYIMRNPEEGEESHD